MSRYAEAVLGQFDRVYNRGTVAGLTGRGLLERFATDADEAAFAAIVARHGPMVLGVCRRVLRDERDVEDAFQATFLVLVRRAGSIRDGDLVGPWLHGVARRVAVRARANAAKTYARESAPVGDPPAPAAPPPGGSELRRVLDEELGRLPESLRAPLVLCYLDGLTHDEAALRLRWPVGTVRSRMARGRDLLRRRLTRRGFSADDAALTAGLAAARVPPEWLDLTVRASLQFATNKPAAVAATSATAAALARGVIDAMTIAKFKVLGAAAMACAVTLGGVRTFAQLGGTGGRAAGEAPRPSKKAGDRPAAVLRDLDKMQTQLRDTKEQLADLEGELKALRAELEALKANPPETPLRLAPPPVPPSLPGPASADALPGAPGEVRAAGTSPGGKPNATKPPGYVHIGQNTILVVSNEGDRAAVYNLVNGAVERVKLSDDKTIPHRVLTITAPGIVALDVKGPKITRLAAYVERGQGGYGMMSYMGGMMKSSAAPAADMNPSGTGTAHAGASARVVGPSGVRPSPKGVGGWYTFELREPVDQASPIVAPGSAVYVLGRRIYAFTSGAGAWDCIEMPEGVKPTPTVGPNGSIRYEHDGHIYSFDDTTGKWKDFDTRTVLDEPEEKDGEPPRR